MSFIYLIISKKNILLEYAFEFPHVLLLSKQLLIMYTFLKQLRIDKRIFKTKKIYIYIVTLNVAKEVVSKALLARGSFHIAR